MPWIAAGDNGRVDIVYYGTNGTGDPTNSLTNAWNVFFAQTLNAADREPVFTVSQATDHIMHVGPICNIGILCSPLPTDPPSRRLLDFFQIAIGPDGLANIGYADDGASNGAAHVSYARQNSGPLALANPSSVTCLPIPVLTSVVSEKVHGSAGPFDINLPLPPTSSPRGVECRGTGPTNNYTLVFTFTNNITSVAGASVTAHNPSSGTGTVSGTLQGPGANQVKVNLSNVSTGQYITVMLNNVEYPACALRQILA